MKNVTCLFVLLPLVVATAFAQPANDDLSDATVIASLPFVDATSNFGASLELLEAVSLCNLTPFHSIWYKYEATADERLLLEVEGTALITTTWTDLDGLHPLSTLMNCLANPADEYIDVESGVTYYFRVASAALFVTGDVDFSLKSAPQPAGDVLASAVNVAALPFSNSSTTEFAGLDSGEAGSSCDGTPHHTVWYEYTAGATDDIAITTTSSANTVTSVWTDVDESHPLSTEVDCAVNADPLSVSVVSGQKYFVSVAGQTDDDEDTFDLSIESESLPVELVQFDAIANGSSVRLTWEMGATSEHDQFQIEELRGEWVAISTIHAEPGVTAYVYDVGGAPVAQRAFRLNVVGIDGSRLTSPVVEVAAETATALAVDSVYPNPAARMTNVTFSSPETVDGTIAIYDLRGREVMRAFDGVMTAGWQSHEIDVSDLAAGTYFVRIESAGRSVTRSLSLVR